MRRFTVSLLAGLTLLVWACGAGDGVESATTDATSADTAPAGGEESETEPAGAEEPDNCSLITSDEATALAGYELKVGEDSILGCGYLPPGSDVAALAVNTAILEGDAASIAAQGFPNAEDIITVDVGEDTVAVITPAGDTVASIITGDSGRFVELTVVFLGIDPGDQARIEEAAALAVTALDRWEGS